MQDNIWLRRAAMLFCLLAGGLSIYVTFKHLFSIILPFLLALAVASPVISLAKKASANCGGKHFKLWAFFYLFFFIVSLSLLITFAFGRLVSEISQFLYRFEASGESIISSVSGFIDRIFVFLGNIPFLRDIGRIDGAEETFSQFFKNIILRFGEALADLLGTLIKSLPSAFISVVISVIACFYFSMDHKRIGETMGQILPCSVSSRLAAIKQKIKGVFWGYLRAYAIIFLITFGELLCGLLILRRNYAFFLALLIAAVDILPLFGTGIILVPWGIFTILSRDYFVGFGLLALFAVVTIVRQFIEPHFLGESLGLHPLLSLFCVFAGFKLFGFGGMLFSPIIAIAVKEFLFSGKKDASKYENFS